MNRIILIQHCQSEHHVNGMTGGWTDTPLTDLGRSQAAAIAARLKRDLADTPCQLYSSDLKRAAQTAEVVGQELGLTVQSVPDLREFNTGIAAGMTRQEAAMHEAPMPEGGPGIDRRPFDGSETWREFYARTSACMDRLRKDFMGLPIIVSHGGTQQNIIAWWLKLLADMLGEVSFIATPGSISVLGVSKWNERAIERLNDRSHLYQAGLAGGEDLRR